MPDLESILKAAPIGLFMLVGSYVARRRRQLGRVRSTTEYPELAARLGLSFKPPADSKETGSLRGRYDGFDVFVESDERPRLVVYFAQHASPGVVLRTYEHEKRTPSGFERFTTGNRFLDRLFKEQFATPELSEFLVAHGDELERLLRPFDAAFRDHLSITPERFEITFDFGRPPYVPPSVIETLIPAAVAVCRLVQEGAREAPPPDT